MRWMGVFEVVVVGVLCGFAVAGYGMVIVAGLAYLFFDPFAGPFLHGVK